jgi:simple sugar transport system ATP-binding protein
MEYAIEMLNITKTFGTLVANDDISLQVMPGEIHALLGENGAGKSTLMSILFGLYTPDSGKILINGNNVVIKNPNFAVKYGLGMVHQHFKLVKVHTVLENIILGKEDTKYGFLTFKKAREKLKDICLKYNFNIDLDKKVSALSVGEQQRVEILKMLYQDSNILIFDEPTAVLTPQEIKGLFGIIKDFANSGKTIIIITHKLDEIKEIAEKCTVLRKGKYIGTVEVKDTTTQELAKMMVGRDIEFKVDKPELEKGKPILEVQNLTYHLNNSSKGKVVLDNINFNVHENEILAIAGIEGNGQTELVELVAGLIKNTNKNQKILLNSENVTNDNILQRIEKGISHIPEDRQKYGLILNYSLEYNEIINRLDEKQFINKYGLILNKNITSYTNTLLEKYDIRSSSGSKGKAKDLSGGNQQKLIISRELEKHHDLLIAVQPTRGLDVGAIDYVHKYIVQERNAGKGILLVSLELDEIMSLSDRIIVLYKGKIVANVQTSETSLETLGEYMLGIKNQYE